MPEKIVLDGEKVFCYQSPYETYEVNIRFATYENGRLAMGLFDANTGEQVTVATVNLPDEKLGPNEIFIHNWSQNEGIMTFLLSNNIVRATGRSVPSGYVNVPICELLVTPARIEK